jgi:hypothetical protein
MPENPISVAQQITRRALPWKRFAELVSSPFDSRMRRHGEVNDAPTLVRQHQKHVQDLESDRRHREEVDGYKAVDVILEESPPGLGRRRSISHKVFAHARFANIDAELQQFAVNARRAPARIVFAHAPDESANLGWNRRPTGFASPDLPCPEEAKRVAVPGNDGFRLDDY